jgi:hypothetical protein
MQKLTPVRHRFEQQLRKTLLPNEVLGDLLRWKSDLNMVSKLREEHMRLGFAETATYKRATKILEQLAAKNELPTRDQILKLFGLQSWTTEAWKSATEDQCYQRRNDLLAGMKPTDSIKLWSYEDVLEVSQQKGQVHLFLLALFAFCMWLCRLQEVVFTAGQA